MTDHLHQHRVDLICTRANGVQPLRQVNEIPEGYQKNRSQIWRLSVNRAYLFSGADLIEFRHRPLVGTFGSGSTRTKSLVIPCDTGRSYIKLCQEAARQANLSWPDRAYDGYAEWQTEWLERRERFRAALLQLQP